MQSLSERLLKLFSHHIALPELIKEFSELVSHVNTEISGPLLAEQYFILFFVSLFDLPSSRFYVSIRETLTEDLMLKRERKSDTKKAFQNGFKEH